MQAAGKPRVTLDHVWIFAALAFIALRALLTPIQPQDFWWHMATGKIIVETGQIPTVDSFSYTQAGQPFYNQSWLGQVLMYGLYQIGGPALLVIVQAALLAATYGLLLRICVERTQRLRLSVIFLLLATMPASFDNWIVRPQTYALSLFIIYLYVLDGWRRANPGYRWQLWLLPALAVVWVNLHGSFVLGGGMIGLTFGAEWLRRLVVDVGQRRAGSVAVAEPRAPLGPLFLSGVLTGAAWLLNPGGFAVLGYVRNLLGSSAVTRLVTEWAPQTVRSTNGVIFFLFVIVGVVVLAYAPRRVNPVDLFLSGVFFWLALGAVRNNLWFIAVATPMVVVQLASWLPRNERPVFQGATAINSVLVGMIGLMVVMSLPWFKPYLGLPPAVGAVISPETPVAAVAFLAQEPERPARLFHDMSYGSYLIWALPKQRVWADPRIELYPLEQWIDYQFFGSGANMEELLARYQIDAMLLSNKNQSTLIEYAQAHPEVWEQRYADDEATYFVRR
ncbi:hypothetical protein [Candidatus Oscillochloris fontis]|uniref:hypothetical protein n=1 Tax=Candidatus Oscillochloris fontis TaxID=2496868 RepID=UPI00101C1999|nr:hypothetical protein [Candidatus Oscillochloris fontis]